MPIDICIPNGNEYALIARAKELGYSGIVFLYQNKSRADIVQKRASLKTASKEFPSFVGTYAVARKSVDIRKLQALYIDSDIIAVSAQSEDIVRFASEQPFIDMVFEITNPSGRDHFEYRRGNLNAVIADLMKKNKQSYALSFTHLLNFEHYALAKVIGREVQNIRYVRRKVPMIIASFACHPEHMRLPDNLSAVSRVMGMNAPQSKTAISGAIENILKRKEHRRSKGYVMPGVKIVE